LPAIITAFLWQTSICKGQDYYEKEARDAVEAIATQTGLTLPSLIKDVDSFLEQQRKLSCEAIDIKWTILPGQKSPMPAKEAEQLNLPQSFAFESKPKNIGYRPGCGVTGLSFAFFKVIVIGTTRRGQIRGLHVVTGDPRQMIVECPEIFGEKSTSETKCGYFTVPEAIVRVIMPKDSGVEELVFFTRVFTKPEEWHLERVGSVSLPKQLD
jgi:hypothetical protein